MSAAIHSLDLSPVRIGAGSLALACHLVFLGVMILPPHLPMPPSNAAVPEIQVDFVVETVVEPLPVPPIPAPPTRRAPITPSTPMRDASPVPLAESTLPVAPPAIVGTVPDTESASPVAVSHSARIAYAHASPPPYPSRARRMGWEGTVILRVEVNAQGRPIQVEIERSSGRDLLDRSAREHVLAHWLFEPAVVAGRPVTASARVPPAMIWSTRAMS